MSKLIKESDIPQVAVASMNHTHEEEVELVNQIAEMVVANQSGEANSEQISEKLAAWLEHTTVHFQSENTLMETHGFPAYAVHSGEHANALAYLTQVIEDWNGAKNIEALAEYVLQTWPNWFHQHVNSMDFVTAQFLSLRGL